MGNKNRSLIDGSSKQRLSNVEYYFKTMMHLTAADKEEQEQVEKLGGNHTQRKNHCSK